MTRDDCVVLEVEALTKRFPGVLALDQVSFDLRRGEVHALCGENGAGKSTLIKTLAGIYPAGSYDGRLRLESCTALFSSVADAEAQGIAVIYQELALIPQMTVAENVFLGCEPSCGGLIQWNKVYSRTTELLRRYNLQLDPAALISNLGVGQQQLVEIVKALAKNARILLLDEPTAALTETEAAILLEIVRDMRRHGVSCIYISHKLDEVFALADRITVLRDGRSVATVDTAQTDKAAVIAHMVGRQIDDFFPRRRGELGAPVLQVENLSVEHAGKLVLENISFGVCAGEVLGIGGLMGAGRSELLLHLFGAFGRRVGGEMRVQARRLAASDPSSALVGGLALVSEDRKRYGLVLGESIGFNLSLASLRQFCRHGLLDRHSEVQANQRYFAELSVKAPDQETIVGTLSGGNQQKVVLGKALMTEPKVVLLDEPTRGIDVGAKVEIYELINRLTAAGMAVVLVSSELPELLGISDRIVILSAGRVGGVFDRGQADQPALLAAAMAHHSDAHMNAPGAARVAAPV